MSRISATLIAKPDQFNRGMTSARKHTAREVGKFRQLLGGGVLAGAGRAAAGGGFFSLAAGISASTAKMGALTAGIGLAGTAVVGISVKAHKTFAEFEKGWAEVTTLMPNLTKRATDEMSKELRKFAVKQGVQMADATKGSYQAISAGIDPTEVTGFLEDAWKGAVGGVSDLTTAVDVITTVLNGYNLGADKATQITDAMFTAVKLGKCVTGDTRVLLEDGGYRRIDELSDGGRVVSFDGRGFVPMNAQWVYQGIKPTVTLVTRLGRRITTTWSHPYLTPKGWREVQDLCIGDSIAVPTHLPYHGSTHVPDHMSGLLGLWLADGASNLTNSSPRITSTRYEDQITTWSKEWGCRVTNIEKREGFAPTWQISAGSRGNGRANPILNWLRGLSLGDTTASTKHIPEEVFTWDRNSQASLLHWLFNGDGWMADLRSKGRSGFQVGFCSNSEQLVRDVSHLLLRFGIVGRVRHRRNAWVWEINRYREVRRFVDLIGIDRPAVEDVLNHTPAKERVARGVVEFDPVVAIKSGSSEHVYDLCVPDLHNFVAEDIVAHNTTFAEMAPELGAVIPLAGAMGVEFEQLTSFIAAATIQGASTSEAVTRLRGALVALSKDTGAKEMFEGLTGQTFPEFIAEGGTVQEALSMIVAEAERTGASLPALFGRIEGSLGALAVSSPRGAEVFAEAMNVTVGATEAAYAKIEATDARFMAKAAARWNEFKIKLGGSISKGLRAIVGFWKKHHEQIMAELEPFIEFFKGLWVVLVAIFKGFVGAWKKEFEEGWLGDMQRAFALFVEPLKAVFLILWDTLRGIFSIFVALFKGDWKGMGESLVGLMINPVKRLIDMFKNLWASMGGLAAHAVNFIMGIVESMWNTLLDFAKSYITNQADMFNKLIDLINNFIRRLQAFPGLKGLFGLTGLGDAQIPPIDVSFITDALDEVKLKWDDVGWGIKDATKAMEEWEGQEARRHAQAITAVAAGEVPGTAAITPARTAEERKEFADLLSRKLEFGFITPEEFLVAMRPLVREAGGTLTSEGAAYRRSLDQATEKISEKVTKAIAKAESQRSAREASLGRRLSANLISTDEYIRGLAELLHEAGGRLTEEGNSYQNAIDAEIERISKESERSSKAAETERIKREDRAYRLGQLDDQQYLDILRRRIIRVGGPTTDVGFRAQQEINRILEEIGELPTLYVGIKLDDKPTIIKQAERLLPRRVEGCA